MDVEEIEIAAIFVGGPVGATWRKGELSHQLCMRTVTVYTCFCSSDSYRCRETPNTHCDCSYHARIVVKRMGRVHTLTVGMRRKKDLSSCILLCYVDRVVAYDTIVVYGWWRHPGDEKTCRTHSSYLNISRWRRWSCMEQGI